MPGKTFWQRCRSQNTNSSPSKVNSCHRTASSTGDCSSRRASCWDNPNAGQAVTSQFPPPGRLGRGTRAQSAEPMVQEAPSVQQCELLRTPSALSASTKRGCMIRPNSPACAKQRHTACDSFKVSTAFRHLKLFSPAPADPPQPGCTPDGGAQAPCQRDSWQERQPTQRERSAQPALVRFFHLLSTFLCPSTFWINSRTLRSRSTRLALLICHRPCRGSAIAEHQPKRISKQITWRNTPTSTSRCRVRNGVHTTNSCVLLDAAKLKTL